MTQLNTNEEVVKEVAQPVQVLVDKKINFNSYPFNTDKYARIARIFREKCITRNLNDVEEALIKL